RDHTAARRQAADVVVRTAHLERAGALSLLLLQPHGHAAQRVDRLDRRRAGGPHHAAQALGGVTDVGEGDELGHGHTARLRSTSVPSTVASTAGRYRGRVMRSMASTANIATAAPACVARCPTRSDSQPSTTDPSGY